MQINTNIGVPHFKTLVKQTRSSSYDFYTCVKELVDNVINDAKNIQINIEYNGTLKCVKISDDVQSGFKNILDKGENSPLNMGHIRDGHGSDDQISEFGTGGKRACIYLADDIHIYTQSVNDDIKYVHAMFCIDEMVKCADASKSYEPDIFEIKAEKYKRIHPYKTGSSVILKSCRAIEDMTHIDGKILCYKLEKELQQTYSNIIRDRNVNINIVMSGIYNGTIKINPLNRIWTHVECSKIKVEYKIRAFIDDDDIVQDIFIECFAKVPKPAFYYYKFDMKCNEDCDSIRKFDLYFNEYVAYGEHKKKFDKFLFDKEMLKSRGKCYNINVNVSSVHHMDKKEDDDDDDEECSLSTYEAYVNADIKAMKYPKSNYIVERKGRCYGTICLIKKHGDGWLNNIYGEVIFTNKKLNKFIGIGYNKQLNNNKQNAIMKCLKWIQLRSGNSAIEPFGFNGKRFIKKAIHPKVRNPTPIVNKQDYEPGSSIVPNVVLNVVPSAVPHIVQHPSRTTPHAINNSDTSHAEHKKTSPFIQPQTLNKEMDASFDTMDSWQNFIMKYKKEILAYYSPLI